MRQPNHGRGGTRHIGRLRIAAAKILSHGLGYEVKPEHIQPATGAWRTDQSLDVYSWELFTETPSGMPVVAGCWLTMTQFVKHANGTCHIDDGEIYPGPKAKQ